MYRDPSTPLTTAQAMMRKKVYDQISNHPDEFDMAWWSRTNTFVNPEMEIEACGTTRCVAGWAQFFAKGEVDTYNVKTDAIELMGLTREEYFDHDEEGYLDVNTALFHVNDSKAVAWMKRLAEDGLKEIGIELDDCEEGDDDDS